MSPKERRSGPSACKAPTHPYFSTGQSGAPNLSWLKDKPLHVCGPGCGHTSGIEMEKKVAQEKVVQEKVAFDESMETVPPEIPVVPSTGNRGMVPRGGDQLCLDCDEPESAHTSPILSLGVIVGYAHPENSCRRFVER